jgi:diguanylate cyclase (GGDEF)-like protein
MERVARVAASVLDAPCTMLAFLGTDRRCFTAGPLPPEWLAHDSGALMRSGLFSRVIDSGKHFVTTDARGDESADVRFAAAELAIAGFAGVPLLAADGSPMGIFCAVDERPREWKPDDVTMLTDLAASVAIEVELRRTLADRERVERQLRHDSLHDPLTGLPNRLFFMQRLSSAVMRARREQDGLFAVLFLDLDNFKLVNDSMGHHVGDELLIAVARRLEECVRGGDVVARLGGDEFALLLERIADARDAALIAERVQKALQSSLKISGWDTVTSASIGVALSSSANEQPEYLLRSADMAMYRAKNAGRSRYEMFNRAMHAEALTRLQTETELRRAIENSNFELQYQPIIALSTGRIAGVEALVRWRHHERGVVSPADFVPVAEETGLILPLGRWVLLQACKQVKEWHTQYPDRPPLSVSVNLSVRQFTQADMVKQVEDVLKETELDPSCLKLEITESVMIDKTDSAQATLAELKRLGVDVHLDDFGTGYSSLSYLHKLPLDAIKIDRALTSHIDTEERPLHLVRTILTLVRGLGLQAIAEGVTTPEQVRRLREMGCAFAQGFLFAKPLTVADAETMISEDPRW